MKVGFVSMFALAAAVICGCSGKSYKDIKVESFELVSVTPTGIDSGDALVRVGLDNPVSAFELFDASATLKVGDVSCATIATDQLVVSGKSSRTYLVPVRISIPEGANLFELLNVLKSENVPTLSMDVSGRVALRGGMGVNVSRNISLSDKMDLGQYVSALAGRSFKDFTVTDFELCSVKTIGNDRCEVLFKLGVSNPYISLELSSMSGVLKLDGTNGLEIYDRDLTVIPKGESTHYLSFDGKISDGFNPCILLNILKETGAPILSADFAARIAMRGGIGKTFRWNNVPLGTSTSTSTSASASASAKTSAPSTASVSS